MATAAPRVDARPKLAAREWPRVTGLDFIDEPLHNFRETPADSVNRRVWLAVLVGVGVLLTAMASFVMRTFTGPIPYKIIPDVRPVIFFLSGFLLALSAAWGGTGRRRLALWGVIGFIIGFHLEEATIHWIGPYPGSITGTRVGLVSTAGSLIALAGILLMHVEVESERLRRDSVRRGATVGGASGLATRLRRAGARRVWGLAGGVAGLGVVIVAFELVIGNESSGGAWSLLLGGALLLVLAAYLLRLLPSGDRR